MDNKTESMSSDTPSSRQSVPLKIRTNTPGVIEDSTHISWERIFRAPGNQPHKFVYAPKVHGAVRVKFVPLGVGGKIFFPFLVILFIYPRHGVGAITITGITQLRHAYSLEDFLPVQDRRFGHPRRCWIEPARETHQMRRCCV
jgi:hypothetical protein